MKLLDLIINCLGIEDNKVFHIKEVENEEFILRNGSIYTKSSKNDKWKIAGYYVMNNLLSGKYTVKDPVNKSSIFISYVNLDRALVSYTGFKNDVINLLFYGLEYMINNTKNKDRKSAIVNGLYNLAMKYNQWR